MDEFLYIADKAVQFDKQRMYKEACYFYREVCRLLEVLYTNMCDTRSETLLSTIRYKIQLYKDRADKIDLYISGLDEQQDLSESDKIVRMKIKKLEKCRFLSSQALDADEAGQVYFAIRLNKLTLQLCHELEEEVSDNEIKKELSTLARQALDNAEKLQRIKNADKEMELCNIEEDAPLLTSSLSPSCELSKKEGSGITSQEPALNRENSGHFLVAGDTSTEERFQCGMPITDKNGLFELPPKQKQLFSHWARLEEFFLDPKIVTGLLQSKAMALEDRPIWYDVYRAFPPALPPKYDRAAPSEPLRYIFYPEDIIRAKFHQKMNRKLPTIDLTDVVNVTVSQRFVDLCQKYQKEKQMGFDDAFESAFDVLKAEGSISETLRRPKRGLNYESKDDSLVGSFRSATERSSYSSAQVNIKDVFKGDDDK